MLHTKSSLVEEAANELINMLLEFEQKEEDERNRDESRTESKVEQMDSDGKICCRSSLQFSLEITQNTDCHQFMPNTSISINLTKLLNLIN